MRRQLQIKDGRVCGGWEGSGGMPVPPDGTWTFVDVTDRKDNPQVGMTYDAATDTFSAPPAPPDYGKTVGPRDFLRFFTGAERKAARNMADRKHTSYDADVEDFMALASVPEPIRLKHPDTLQGLALLVAKGALTSARRDAIVSGGGA